MKWIAARVRFNAENRQQATDLISEAFYNLGVKGVVVDDPEQEPEEGWADQIEARPDADSVTGYFPDNESLHRQCDRLEKELQRLEAIHSLNHIIEYQKIDEQDWAESWKEYFYPEKVGDKIVVKPTWREYEKKSDEIVIEIDPGMAFGTGTHPTTSLSIRMLETYVNPGSSFLDVGTGSGILMVSAAKLGAGRIRGVDVDEEAVRIARENLLLNHIEPDRFEVGSGDLTAGVDETFDIVAANILSNVIIVLLDHVRSVLKPGGLFICSGIIRENMDKVLRKMESVGLNVMEVRHLESWVAVCGKIRSR